MPTTSRMNPRAKREFPSPEGEGGAERRVRALSRSAQMSANPRPPERSEDSPLHYVLDFFCEELNPVVELDEPDAIDYDNERTAFLQSRGLTVVRIANDELRDNERGVFDRLERIIDGLQRLSSKDP